MKPSVKAVVDFQIASKKRHCLFYNGSKSYSVVLVTSVVRFSPLVFSNPLVSLKSLFRFSDFHDSLRSARDRRFKLILMSIIYGTKGGINRAKILDMICDKPQNAHKIASGLGLDYKTVLHHIKILTKNEMIEKNPEVSYAADYSPTSLMRQNVFTLKEIMEKIGTR